MRGGVGEPLFLYGSSSFSLFLEGARKKMMNIVVHKLEDSDSFKAAPVFTPIRRLDETQAARKPILRWKEEPLIAV